MAHPELLTLSILRALVEVALLTLLGQEGQDALAGARRQANPIYALFLVVTRPVMRAVRMVTPSAILDRHLPFVAFFLLFWLWIALAWLKREICQAQGLAC